MGLYGEEYFTEAITETKHGYDTGISVKGKNIIVSIYKGEPTKEEVESKIDMFKANAKLISKNWNTIIDEAAKHHKDYIDTCYSQTKKMINIEIILRCLKNIILLRKLRKVLSMMVYHIMDI